MSTSKIHVFRYQPELSGTVIYWSMTFALFFTSMIGLLEQQGQINLFSVLVFLIFLFAAFVGFRRKMILTNEQLKVSAILKKNSYLIDLGTIESISVGSHGITIKTEEKEFAYVMFPKSKNSFVHHLRQDASFTGIIYGIEKSVD